MTLRTQPKLDIIMLLSQTNYSTKWSQSGDAITLSLIGEETMFKDQLNALSYVINVAVKFPVRP